MANRAGRRQRQNVRLAGSRPNGTPTPDPPLGDVIPMPNLEERGAARLASEILADSVPDVEAIERGWQARQTLEAMGFVVPRPGEAFGELGGLGLPPDPLEQRIRRELGL